MKLHPRFSANSLASPLHLRCLGLIALVWPLMTTSPGSHAIPADDDRTLTTRVRAGDGTAFETLFRTHYSSLCSVAFGYLQTGDAAEDAVQNVFRAVWLHRATWFPYGAIGPYLRTAVRNEALNALRGARRIRLCASKRIK